MKTNVKVLVLCSIEGMDRWSNTHRCVASMILVPRDEGAAQNILRSNRSFVSFVADTGQ
jgi:hypothetical protein